VTAYTVYPHHICFLVIKCTLCNCWCSSL